MLYRIFMQILQMGVTASVVIIAILCVRGLMHRLPKRYLYLLWAVVGIRLVCPVAAASPVSIFNIAGADFMSTMRLDGQGRLSDRETEQGIAVGTMRGDVLSMPSGKGQEGQDVKKVPENGTVSGWNISNAGVKTAEYSPLVRYGLIVWLAGMAVIFLRNFYATVRMKKCLEKAVRYQENIYECDNIPSPFVMGIFRPRIYIPFRLEEGEREYILKHEQYHIKRRDYIVKVAAFLLTCVYWFHPLVWLSYFLMIRDMEMSCDEYVLQSVPEDIRASYSKSLLGFAVNRRGMAAGLLAFGETDARKRVKNVLNFKRHKRWVGVIAIVLVAVAGTACLTNARDGKTEEVRDISQRAEGGEEDDKSQGTNDEAASQDEVAGQKKKDGMYEAVVATGEAHGYQVQVAYISGHQIPDKKDLDFGMYEGEFHIRTYRNDTVYADYKLQAEGKMYFPVDGFALSFQDYDGDGTADDFTLGQGQTREPALGNFMSYWFFAVDEDGSIVRYVLSTENGERLVTVPGEYSKAFACKDGRIVYQALTGNGTEEQGIEIRRAGSRSFSDSDIEDAKKAVKKHFKKRFPDCEIKKLWYDEELYKKHVSYFTERYGKEVIILYSDFYVEKKCKLNSLEKDHTYRNFMWVLSRKEGSGWKVRDSGY